MVKFLTWKKVIGCNFVCHCWKSTSTATFRCILALNKEIFHCYWWGKFLKSLSLAENTIPTEMQTPETRVTRGNFFRFRFFPSSQLLFSLAKILSFDHFLNHKNEKKRMHSSRMRTGSRGGGCQLPGGVCSGGGLVSQHALRQNPPPPVNRMTDRCKNITLTTTSLRPVIIEKNLKMSSNEKLEFNIYRFIIKFKIENCSIRNNLQGFLWSYYLHGMYLQLVSGIVMLQTDGSNNFCGGFLINKHLVWY